jgi:tetratricopeptide (TPR) repeat protein
VFRNRGNPTKSPFPTSQPANGGESYEDFIERLQSLIAGDDADVFFDAMDRAPTRWQRKPEFMLIKALGLLQSGERDEAKKVLDEIERTHPRFGPLYFYKATLYLEDMFPAHVLRMTERLRSMGRMDDESESEIGKMADIARLMIKESAEELGVSYDKMEKASWYHEAAQEKMQAGQWVSAEQMAREAIRQIPHWTSPRNNRSYILYFMGRVQEAFAEAQAVLAQHPDNLYALKNLTLFHAGFDEYEKAHEYSGRIFASIQSLPPDDDLVDVAINALALAQDDENLWTLAQKYLKNEPGDLLETSWHTLGIAAIRKGRLKDARRLLEKVDELSGPNGSLVIEVRKALMAGKPLSSNPSYPTLGYLLPPSMIRELIDILGNYMRDEQLPRHVQKKLGELVQKRPFVVNGLFRLLLEPGAAEAIPILLVQFNKPEIDARLIAFALGDVGSSHSRLNALAALSEMGRELPPNPIRFWNEEKGEWSEVDFNAQMLSDDFDLNISPEASRWAQKAHETDDIQEKIRLWHKAVETDPKSGYAVHMLGILLIQNGQREEGMKLARRAIEVDPDYIFAYANLAMIEMQEEKPNVELVQKYLGKVSKAPVITAQTAFIVHYTLMLLAVERDDFETARKEYELAFDLRPDDPMLEGWDARLRLGEVFAGGWLAKWHEESRQRAHNKALKTRLDSNSGAHVTLNSLTREVLGTVARLWGLTAYGKKAELINKIVEEMQDVESFRRAWAALSPAEQEASQWVLENNGARGWKEFTEKYGDDADESPYWNYHEPKSIIGRLRRAGVLALGTLDNEQVVFMPVEIRNSLKAIP